VRRLSAFTTLFLALAAMAEPALCGTFGCPGISDCTPLEVSGTAFALRPLDVTTMLRDLNSNRARHGLMPLIEDRRLDAIARAHAVEMIARRYFAHDSADGRSPFARMDQAGIAYQWAGENIAHDASALAATDALWQSPRHRANLLGPHFARVGIVALAIGDAGELVVEDFTD